MLNIYKYILQYKYCTWFNQLICSFSVISDFLRENSGSAKYLITVYMKLSGGNADMIHVWNVIKGTEVLVYVMCVYNGFDGRGVNCLSEVLRSYCALITSTAFLKRWQYFFKYCHYIQYWKESGKLSEKTVFLVSNNVIIICLTML